MQFIPTRAHGVLDYLSALVMIFLPFLVLGGAASLAAWILIGSGVGVIVVSLLTRYEFGLAKVIPMPLHLVWDGLLGVFLIASPWLFGFADVIWWPHVALGVLSAGAAVLTQPHSPEERAYGEAAAAAPSRR